MTETDVCPEISILSSFLDGELLGDEKASVKAHTESCSACAARLNDLRVLDQVMMRNVGNATDSTETSRNEGCITPASLTAYFHGVVANEERTRVEDHLDRCDACLAELTALARVEAQLEQSPTQPLPNFLRERVEALWKKGEKAKERLLSIAVRLVGEGIEIIRDSLFPQGVSFQEVFAQAGAYRTGTRATAPSGILVKRQLPGFQLSLLVESEKEDRAGLKVKLEDEKANPLAEQRVLLRRQEILLFSARTDAEGKLAIGNLEPGSYRLGIIMPEQEYYVDLAIDKG